MWNTQGETNDKPHKRQLHLCFLDTSWTNLGDTGQITLSIFTYSFTPCHPSQQVIQCNTSLVWDVPVDYYTVDLQGSELEAQSLAITKLAHTLENWPISKSIIVREEH